MSAFTASAPALTAIEGRVVVGSRQIAESFGKRHDNVLRAIETLECSEEFRLLNFEETSDPVQMPRGGVREDPAVNMTRDGFAFLVMGFTGSGAAIWKERYIAAFNAMEAKLRRAAMDPMTALGDPAAMRGLLLTYTEKVLALETQVDDMREDVEAHERLTGADGSLSITEAAKALALRPKDLFQWLSHNGWIYKRPNGGAWLGYQTKCNQGLLEHRTTTVLRADGSEKITEQVRVAPKGLSRMAKIIHPAARLIA